MNLYICSEQNSLLVPVGDSLLLCPKEQGPGLEKFGKWKQV